MGCFALLCFEMIFRCFTFVWCYAYRESLGNNACLECVFVLNEMWSFVHWTYIDLEPFKYLFFLFNNISKGNTFKLVPWNIEVPFYLRYTTDSCSQAQLQRLNSVRIHCVIFQRNETLFGLKLLYRPLCVKCTPVSVGNV